MKKREEMKMGIDLSTKHSCYKCKTPFRLTTVGSLIVCVSCEADDALVQYGLVRKGG